MKKADVYTVRYSDGTEFHWTLWGSHRIPLIRINDSKFEVVCDKESKVALCALLLRILKLPTGQHNGQGAEKNAQKQKALVRGRAMECCPHWATVVFSSGDISVAYYWQAVISHLAALVT